VHEQLPVAMKSTLCRVLGAAVLATGCGYPPYEQPPPNVPHALAKVRIVNHSAPGPALNESLVLNERQVLVPATGGNYLMPRTMAVRIRLEPATWTMRTSFFHTYTTTSTQSYSYACGKSNCTGTRTVTNTHTVVDGACAAGLAFAPAERQMYLLQYDFYAHGVCSLQCFEQVPMPDGSFRLRPCSATPVRVN
jgi:hypothetical protein